MHVQAVPYRRVCVCVCATENVQLSSDRAGLEQRCFRFQRQTGSHLKHSWQHIHTHNRMICTYVCIYLYFHVFAFIDVHVAYCKLSVVFPFSKLVVKV